MKNRLKFTTVIAGLALVACGRNDTSTEAPAMFTADHGLLTVPRGSPLRSRLQIETLNGAAGQASVDIPASIEAEPTHVTNILAPLTGRVKSLNVTLGQRVRQGQVLAVLASGDMAQAAADDLKARDALSLATKALQRTRGLRQAGGAADKDLEAAQSAYNQSRAEAARAEERLKALGGDHSGGLALTAPMNGVVTVLNIGAGAQVSDPTATLMTITNTDQVFATLNIPENEAGRIQRGQRADIMLEAYPGEIFQGEVAEADPVLSSDTRRQKARIVLGNPGGRLMPGMYGTAKLALPAGPAGTVSVPQSALLMNNDAVSVLVEVHPWEFERRAVVLGDETSETARVIRGLRPGERIVVRGGILLND